ncbi:NAD(P)-dependent oxidoreductase [Haloferula sp. A504]|uniref:NAD(P)-dependent oxidoreductase n=1 Tax=Haloferula sp. A504 TaxID=3373601 RepID=UPI0031C3A405|nr:NAD(P)-dependent oxidoreductase [Verrucomicrobiaceae bacterium E54]
MSETTPQSIGILGLGIIGEIWAGHHHAAGKLAGAWNRTAKPDFPMWKDTAAEVARGAEAIQIVVADPPAVQGVVEAILPELDASKAVIQSSTIDPDSSGRFREQVLATGARYLEAPFTGSKPAAEQKQTVFYLGGDRGLCEAVDPLLALVSAHRLHIGDHRQACALKLAMNLNISAQMQALAEARAICSRSGIDDDTFFDALSRNVSCSGLTQLKEPVLRQSDFRPMFSVKHMHKDMRLASGMSESGDCELLKTVTARLAAAEQAGWGDEDFAALAKLLGG